MNIGIVLISTFMLTMFGISAFISVSIAVSKERFISEFTNTMKQFNYTVPENFNPDVIASVMIVTSAVFALIYLISGIGLLAKKKWGVYAGVAIGIIHLLYGISSLPFPAISIPNILIGAILIYYLRKPEVLDGFERKMSIEERILGRKLE